MNPRPQKHASILPLLAGLLIALPACELAAAEILLTVSAGDHDCTAVPLAIDLPQPLRGAAALSLVETDSGRTIPVQIIPGKPPRIAWIVRNLAAGQSRTCRLAVAQIPTPAHEPVTCTNDGTRLSISIGDRPVLSYNHAVLPAPEGVDPVFEKSGHIHPLHTPAGRPVTDDFPPDHAHQHGIFFAWVNTTFEGRSVDFWNQAKKTGTVQHAEIAQTVSGPVFAQFTVKLLHSDLTAPKGPQPVLEELWTVRVYNIDDPFLVDLASEQRCVARQPLVINHYHYGGMGLRGARQWFHQQESDFLTSTGKSRSDGNHTRARWVLTHGLSDGQPATVAMLGHPDNFRAPQHVRLHPDKPYFCFAPMVIGQFEIAPGQPYLSQYRYATFDGPPDPQRADRLWHDYADPPTVDIVEK